MVGAQRHYSPLPRVCRSLLLWLGLLVLAVSPGLPQEHPAQPQPVYAQASRTLLETYVQQQRSWNHYFTTIASEQRNQEQIQPQEKYRRFLAETLSQWRQLTPLPSCQSAHRLYELGFVSYGVAADFRLTFLYARSTWLGSPSTAVSLAEERSRHYTTRGDDYFQQAATLAQAHGCVGTSTSP